MTPLACITLDIATMHRGLRIGSVRSTKREILFISDAEYYVYGGDGTRVRKVTERLLSIGNVEVIEKIYLDGCEIKQIRANAIRILERKTSHITDVLVSIGYM